MSKSSKLSRLARAAVATGVATAAILAGTATPAFAAVTVTLSATAGPTAGTNTITATSTTAQSYLTGSTTPQTVFSMAACPATYTSAASTPVLPSSAILGLVLSTNTVKLSSSKASILVPALVVITGISTKYNVCIYASSTANSTLLGSSTYTVAVAPVIADGAVDPANGPSLGGTLITVTGTSFPTAANSISGTLGGTALTSVTPVSSTSFTAIAPAHSPGSVSLAMTTAAGTQTLTGAYTYANGITISPNTAPNTEDSVYIDVMGAGFLNYDFTLGDAKVWLVDGLYDSTDTTTPTKYNNGPSAECDDVVVVGDNELICNLDLLTGLLDPTDAAVETDEVPIGTYTLTVVTDFDVDAEADNLLEDPPIAYDQTELSSGATFTVADY